MKHYSKKIVATILCLLLVISTSFTGFSANGYDRGYSGAMAGDGKIYAEGLDVSSWQGASLDFANIKNAGYSFVILRCGTTKGKDTCFETYYRNAKAVGLDVGAYYYSYATTVDEGYKDAVDCMNFIAGKTFEYPIYFDYEDPSQSGLNTNLSASICYKFLDTLKANNYLTGLYSMASWLESAWITTSGLRNAYEGWVAHYLDDTYTSLHSRYSAKYGMYQYTSSKTVNGKGPYDANVAYKDYPEIVKKYGFNGYSPNNLPQGMVDDLIGDVGSVKVRGWAFDKDDTSKNLEIHVYVGGIPGSANAQGNIVIADTLRADVDAVHKCGDNHGFDAKVATSLTGEQPVYVYAIDSNDPSTNTLLVNKTVTITADTEKPKVSDLKVESSDYKSFTLSCDAKDNGAIRKAEFSVWTKEAPAEVKKYDGAIKDGVITCTVPIADFEDYNGIYYADVKVNDGAGNSDEIKGFSMSYHLPKGMVDEVSDLSGAIRVRGWAFDADDMDEALEIHVYIGGLPGEDGVEFHKIKADVLRTDVNTAYGCGDYHGYKEVIYTSLKGEQPVYIYAINTGNGDNMFINKKTVNITSPIRGDADRSGVVDIADVTYIQKVLAGYIETVGEDLYIDLNDNGKVDIRDATRIQLFLAEKISSL